MKESLRFAILKERRREALMLIAFAAAAILLVYCAGNRSGAPPDSGTSAESPAVSSAPAEDSPPAEAESLPFTIDPTSIRKAPDLSCWQVDEEGWLYTSGTGETFSSVWKTVDGQLYYFKENGRFAAGWTSIDGKTYWFDPAGRLYRDLWASSPDGRLFRLSEDGSAVTGWYTESDGRVFYMAPDGSVQYGWQDIDGSRYYLGGDGVLVTGFREIDGNHYYFTDSGKMHTGWADLADGRHYFYSDGTMAVGLVTIDDALYAFSAEGVLLTGMQTFDGALYYFGEDGRVVTGWVTAEDGKHYFDAPGSQYIGWHYYDNGWHFFTSSGVLDESRKYTDSPAVAITFDDGPGEYTDELLSLLESYHVKATFFMIGTEVEKYPDAVKREFDIGMEQGNHTWDHTTLTKLTAPEIARQITSTNDAVKAITGKAPTLFRPPGGGTNATVEASSQGMPLITWNVDTRDWETRDTWNTVNVVMNEVSDGDIILMHEIYQASYEAAREIIPRLLERGYQLVTVSELAKLKNTELKGGQVYSDFN